MVFTACDDENGAHKNIVYTAGVESNDSNNPVAKYWVDTVGYNLTDGTHFARANSIFISQNNDIYVAGYESNNKNINIWKEAVLEKY